MSAFQKLEGRIRQLKIEAAEAESKIDQRFEEQDKLFSEEEKLSEKILSLEEKNIFLIEKEKQLETYAASLEQNPRLEVTRTAFQGVRISGPNSTLTLQADQHRCTIQEEMVTDDGVQGFKMSIKGSY